MRIKIYIFCFTRSILESRLEYFFSSKQHNANKMEARPRSQFLLPVFFSAYTTIFFCCFTHCCAHFTNKRKSNSRKFHLRYLPFLLAPFIETYGSHVPSSSDTEDI